MFQNIINGQYRRPSGLLGQFIGNRMAKDHQPENLWTVAVLRAQPTDHILEIGFGPGLAIKTLTAIVTQGRIAGIDFSKTMVRSAQKRNANALKRGQVDLRYGDAADLPFDDHAFDKAFSIHSIYFWPHPLDALKEIERVLKPKGKVVLTVLPKERWNEDNPDMPVGTSECKPYSGNELIDMLNQAGFRTTHIEADSNSKNRSNFCVIGEK
jgi:ubiquinone/menaquinone biosynthesis C-methylase UbiE